MNPVTPIELPVPSHTPMSPSMNPSTITRAYSAGPSAGNEDEIMLASPTDHGSEPDKTTIEDLSASNSQESRFNRLDDRATNREEREAAAVKKDQPLLKKLKAKFTKLAMNSGSKLIPPSPTVESVHSIMAEVVTPEDMERERKLGNNSKLPSSHTALMFANDYAEFEIMNNIHVHRAHRRQKNHNPAQETLDFVVGWEKHLRTKMFVPFYMKPAIRVLATLARREVVWARMDGLLFPQPGWKVMVLDRNKYQFTIKVNAKSTLRSTRPSLEK
jgi:hypothetical protein